MLKLFQRKKFGPTGRDRFKWLQNLGLKTVLDVGAHQGESAVFFSKILPEAQIYCFEPVAENFFRLGKKLRDRSRLHLYNCALGSRDGQQEIFANRHSPSSSILKVDTLGCEAFPFIEEKQTEPIEVLKLDTFSHQHALSEEILLKIDVQGYEKEVILGAAKILPRIKIIILETSFAQLYEGQPLFPEIYGCLKDRGFEYIGCLGQLLHPHDGKPLQQDSIFINQKK